ncbi:MAG: DUF1016 N-terminal domain-containing protein [Spirochaetaceae bacterium]|nr:DUF1016 N-terminal domain-containing protein [Spirochaetaceae bacterium]
MRVSAQSISFGTGSSSLKDVNDATLAKTSQAINVGLTLRNWLFGLYIREYEQNGLDRAEYGERLLEKLSNSLEKYRIPRTEERELRRYRQFYLSYPQIRDTVSPEFKLLPDTDSGLTVSRIDAAIRSPDADSGDTVSRIQENGITPQNSGQLLVSRLSFSHFRELIAIDDSLKRLFYEVECIKGNWSVRELKRQIASLYYERSGMSKNKKKLITCPRINADLHGLKLSKSAIIRVAIRRNQWTKRRNNESAI